jgi:hypothetical protein
MTIRHTCAVALLAGGCAAAMPSPEAKLEPAAGAAEARLDMARWRVIEQESGPTNYYQLVKDPAMPFIRGRYRPPYKTTVLGYDLGDELAKSARVVKWKWRAVTLPRGADECVKSKSDSAAVIYLTWKRGLRYYTLKYVWSSSVKRGTVCEQKRNPFVAQDTVVLQSGGAGSSWRSEAIDLHREFRRHFAKGDPKAEIPRFLGIGIMTDGDQTRSESAADYADFVISRAP